MKSTYGTESFFSFKFYDFIESKGILLSRNVSNCKNMENLG